MKMKPIPIPRYMVRKRQITITETNSEEGIDDRKKRPNSPSAKPAPPGVGEKYIIKVVKIKRPTERR
jgi:hypothetical protein